MKNDELLSKTYDQLKSTLNDLKKESFNIRFQRMYGQITNTNRINQVKKDIARILTILNNKRNNHA